MDTHTLSWKTHEFEKKERHRDWIWTAGFIALVIAIASFFYGNIFFGIFSLVAGGSVIFFALREPREITVILGEKSISTNGHEILYTNIEKFWLDESGKTDKLLLAVKSGLMAVIVIPIAEISTDAVRDFLKEKQIIEAEAALSFSTQLFDRLGF